VNLRPLNYPNLADFFRKIQTFVRDLLEEDEPGWRAA
jgi:hypothetical protein